MFGFGALPFTLRGKRADKPWEAYLVEDALASSANSRASVLSSYSVVGGMEARSSMICSVYQYATSFQSVDDTHLQETNTSFSQSPAEVHSAWQSGYHILFPKYRRIDQVTEEKRRIHDE